MIGQPELVPANCLNCGRTEAQIPLVIWHYQGGEFKICPICIPALIHEHQAVLAKWQEAGLLRSSTSKKQGE